MRIVGGEYRGHRIFAPKGMETRPTTDRTRESLFNILNNRIDFEGIRTADFFAGSGALGLEALSRGAGFCLFVDIGDRQCAAIRQNIKSLGLEDMAIVHRSDASRFTMGTALGTFDLVFADPPYGKGLGEKLAKSMRAGGWLNPDGLFVLEESSSHFPDQLEGFSLADRREYGETTIGLFEVTAA